MAQLVVPTGTFVEISLGLLAQLVVPTGTFVGKLMVAWLSW